MEETPSSTSSSYLYLRMALAEEKILKDQLLPAAFMSASRSMARWRWSRKFSSRSEEHTSELQSLRHLVCRLLLEKEKHTSALQSLRHLVCPLPVAQNITVTP